MDVAEAYLSRLRRKGAEDTNSEPSENKIFAEDSDIDQRESKNSKNGTQEMEIDAQSLPAAEAEDQPPADLEAQEEEV